MVLAEYYAQYEKDPDFVAEGLALSIIDNALYAMKRQGITRSELAATMGIPKSQVSRIFNAPPNLTLRSIARIALALEVKPQELLNTDAPTQRAAARQTAASESEVDIAEAVSVSGNSSEIEPDEQIARSHRQHQETLSDQILDSMESLEPADFERLVMGLLTKMGYGDGQVTGKSGDQVIDGILDEDTLGLEKVYVQAKRYDTSQVGEPEIRNFAGSLDRQGAIKGVFITTSTFSPTARQAARDISMGSKSVRLVDGQELAQMMIKHNVGVFTTITYEVKKLDANYFAEI